MIAIINTIIAVMSCVIYFRGIKSMKYTSSLAAWLIWSVILTFLTIVTLVQSGLTATGFLLLLQLVTHIGMLIATYKYVSKKLTPAEIKLLAIATTMFVIWLVAYFFSPGSAERKEFIGIVGQIVADAIGAIAFIPLVLRAPFKLPLRAWLLTLLVYPLTILDVSLHHQESINNLYPAYGLSMYGLMWLILVIARVLFFYRLPRNVRIEMIAVYGARRFKGTSTPPRSDETIIGSLSDEYRALCTIFRYKQLKLEQFVVQLANSLALPLQAVRNSVSKKDIIVMKQVDKQLLQQIYRYYDDCATFDNILSQHLQETYGEACVSAHKNLIALREPFYVVATNTSGVMAQDFFYTTKKRPHIWDRCNY